jgi:prolyl 4-hydroxylase
MQVFGASSSFLAVLTVCWWIIAVLQGAYTAGVADAAVASASADELVMMAAGQEKQHEILDVVVEPDGSTIVKVRLDKETSSTASSSETPVPPLTEQDIEEEDEGEDFDYGGADFDDADYDDDNGGEITPEDIAELYGEPQSMEGYDPAYLLEVDAYMKNVVAVEAKFEGVQEHCLNKDGDCTLWAQLGECDKNPGYMLTNCGPACRSCDKLIFEERCPMDPKLSETDAWKPGDLNRFFERITTHPHYQQYSPSIACHPGVVNEHVGRPCPWVVAMDGFLTENECDALIEQGGLLGYERSEDVGERNPDGSYGSVQSAGRTSTNAWCSETCLQNETVKGVIRKLENLTGIPDANSEQLQLLRYEVGQFYNSHHDFIEHDVGRRAGPRILTVFLYLNDVEAGGATHFTDLNISVYPKKGRVLLWPSVLDEDPNAWDDRTHHQANPVEAGVKYGANAWVRRCNSRVRGLEVRDEMHRSSTDRLMFLWSDHLSLQVHLRDFKAPYADGCA